MSRPSGPSQTHVTTNTGGAQGTASTSVAYNPIPVTPASPTTETVVQIKKGKTKTSAGAFYGLVFLVTLIIAFFVFYLMKPTIVMKKIGGSNINVVSDEIDWVKVLIASVIVAILVTALVWIVRAFVMKP